MDGFVSRAYLAVLTRPHSSKRRKKLLLLMAGIEPHDRSLKTDIRTYRSHVHILVPTLKIIIPIHTASV